MKKINKIKTLVILIMIIPIMFFLTGFNNPEEDIIETWLLEDSNPEYKLIFTSDGKCKEYEDNILLSVYSYSIENNSCSEYSASNTIYLKWKDTNGIDITCFEISAIGENYLSLMIIDKGKILFFNKQ